MRKFAALLVLATMGCQQPQTSKKNQEIVFVTYSAAAAAEGTENWSFALFQGGLEEMLAKEESRLMEMVSERSEALTRVNSKLLQTETMTEEARPETFSRILATRPYRREAGADIGSNITEAGASKVEASQKTGKETVS